MNEERQMTIHFNNGTKLEIAFPVQIKNSQGALLEALKRILESDKLAIQAEGRLIVVPWASVKYVEASAVVGTALPFGTIKDARILSSDETRPT